MDFREEKRGYDRSQVDRYIDMLQNEYETMQGEYQNLAQRCESLSSEMEKANGVIDRLQTEPPRAEAYAPPGYGSYGASQYASSPFPPSSYSSAPAYGSAPSYAGGYSASAMLDSAKDEAAKILAAAKREAEQIKAVARKELDEMVMAKLKITSELREMYGALGKYVDIPRPFERNDIP